MFHKRPTNCSQAPKRGCNSPNPTTTRFPIVGLFFSINLRKNIKSFFKNYSIISKKGSYSKIYNDERNVRIFVIGAELQLSL